MGKSQTIFYKMWGPIIVYQFAKNKANKYMDTLYSLFTMNLLQNDCVVLTKYAQVAYLFVLSFHTLQLLLIIIFQSFVILGKNKVNK